MGITLSIPTKTYQVATSISQKHTPYKPINDAYYRNPSLEILYDKDIPTLMIGKDVTSGKYILETREIENIHKVSETHDILIETDREVYIVSSEVNVMSKPKRHISECEEIRREIAGFTTQFTKRI